MMNGERTIVDTNVLVSALLAPHTTPRQALDAAHKSGTLIASEATLLELIRTLHKPALQPYLSPTERDTFFQYYAKEIERIAPTEEVRLCRDPSDNRFLELPVAGDATWLITGDEDLLTLGSFRSTIILTPSAFLRRMNG